ncbi:MAG: DoxX family membrane protein [bacterium]|nr:DoxX family membrane protein [bacterium]
MHRRFFFFAGAAKLAQPAGLFAHKIKAFGILSGGWELPLAYLLPWLELFCGSFLLVGFFSRWAAISVMVQLVTFAAAISVGILSGAALEDCGCLPGVSETPAQALVRDIIMIVWLSVSFQGLPGKLSLDGWLESRGE